MARILIAGCGYVGSAAGELFHAAGWEVEGWTASVQSAARLADRPYLVRAIDLADRQAVARAGGEFDAVIQAASSRGGGEEAYRRVYLESARNLVAKFPRARLLFTSSTSVYAQTTSEWVTELSPAEPERGTARILREAEDLVLARDGLVARLAGIYGPGRSALLRTFLSGEAVLGPDSDRFVNQVHRDDVAAAMLLLIEQTPPLHGIFNVSDSEPLTRRACYEFLAQQFARPLPPASDMPLYRRRGNSNKRVTSAKLQALGWLPRYPTFAGGITQSVLPNLERLGA